MLGVSAQSITNNQALLVIDMQEEFTLNSSKQDEFAGLINNINDLISALRPIEIIFIQANIRVLSISLKGIKTEAADHLELDSRLDRKKNDPVFMKNESSALKLPDLIAYLESRKIDHLYISGIYLGECVSKTAINALERGYTVTIVENTVKAKRPSKSGKLLDALEEQGVEVVTDVP
jgi:nicotinamidase-related amidase